MKINKKTAIIIIGFGSIGKRHYSNLLKIGYKNITVFDPVDDVFIGTEKVNRLGKINEKVLKDFKIAFICNPNNFHLKYAIMCVQAGCQIFIEKPLSNNLKNIDKLISVTRKNKTINMVACNMRFHPCLEFIKNYLDKKKIGKIYSIQHEFGYYLPNWRPQNDYIKGYAAKKITGGGIILDDIHEFDLLFWLNDFKEVMESKFIFDKVSNLEIETEDICIASFRFKNKVLGLVKCDYLQKKYNRKCKIIGEHGNIRWDFNENIIWFETKESLKKLFKIKDYEANIMYIDEIKYFLKCLKENKQTFNNIEKSFYVLRYCVKRK